MGFHIGSVSEPLRIGRVHPCAPGPRGLAKLSAKIASGPRCNLFGILPRVTCQAEALEYGRHEDWVAAETDL